jgi:hypothetical protein
MAKMTLLLTGLVICALGPACLAGPPADSGKSAPAKPGLFKLVQDMPCEDVLARVRQKLSQDKALGLAGEEKLAKGMAFRLAPQEKKDRKWQAVVRVECFEALTSRISVSARAWVRGPDGAWREEPRATDIEQEILAKLTP